MAIVAECFKDRTKIPDLKVGKFYRCGISTHWMEVTEINNETLIGTHWYKGLKGATGCWWNLSGLYGGMEAYPNEENHLEYPFREVSANGKYLTRKKRKTKVEIEAERPRTLWDL